MDEKERIKRIRELEELIAKSEAETSVSKSRSAVAKTPVVSKSRAAAKIPVVSKSRAAVAKTPVEIDNYLPVFPINSDLIILI